MIDGLSDEQTADVVYAFLKVGVPPTAVAKATGLDTDDVKAVVSQMRVDKYGTDEIDEAMTHLIWVGYETALQQIEYGTPASKARFIQLVLSRSVGIAGKSNPETSEKIRAELATMAAEMQPDIQLAESIYTPTD
jgi:hypothetical protein